jgi:4,5-dihydroxyphthalate decarboxylase
MNNKFGILALCLIASGSRTVHGGDLPLKIATQDHPHIRAIQDGRVKVEGCAVEFSTQPASATNQDLINGHQWDVLEVELLPFIVGKSSGAFSDYTLIPVFPTRSFQLRNVYVRTDKGIHRPEDLRGKKIGAAGGSDTAQIWLRGILQSSWSVHPDELTWISTSTRTNASSILSDWLVAGKVDAIFTPEVPQAFIDKNPLIARMFPDYREAEYATFKDTRIFPIITAIAVKEQLVKDNPWLPESLFLAFSESKKIAMQNMTLPLPWGGAQLAETEEVMGKNFWSYGVKSNPKTLGALFRYAQDQGRLSKPLAVDDVFDPSTILLIEP